MRQRRIAQVISVAVLGFALASAPMSLAGAGQYKTKSHHKAKHPKTKHPKAKTASKQGSNPTSSICTAVNTAQSGSNKVGSALESAIEQAATNFAAAKQAMITALNGVQKEESAAEAELHSAPANVQAAMKGLFAVFTTMETAINNSSSLTQLGTSLETLGQNAQLQADSQTVTNYVTSLCGATTTTTTSTFP